jgi:hypothetical protein
VTVAVGLDHGHHRGLAGQPAQEVEVVDQGLPADGYLIKRFHGLRAVAATGASQSG